ncbi:MAG: Endonuclease/exonuclease/phosphatase, partial [Actinomycetia bacterium]|nr:Endonuclease/exonuclease/phosphatase [Actinomycetes bacterium]
MRLAGLDSYDRSGFVSAPLAFTPYVGAFSVFLLVLALVTRRRVLVAVALVTVLAFGYALVPRVLGDPVGRPDLRVLTVNLRLGQASAPAVVALIRQSRPDVVSLQELTPGAVARLDAAGLASVLPFRALSPLSGASGTGLLARYPLTAPGNVDQRSTFLMTTAVLRVPGHGPVTLVAVHTSPPIPGSAAGRWQRDFALLPHAGSGAAVLAGDYNATLDHAPLRSLIGTGYADAAAASGHGFVRSWPTDKWLPPVTIDHVLIRGLHAFTVRGVTIPNTDHRALLADLSW